MNTGWAVNKGINSGICKTTDGGYIITGYTNSYGDPDGDVWIIKTDSFGDTIWTKSFGGINDDIGWSAELVSTGGYVIAGEKNIISFKK